MQEYNDDNEFLFAQWKKAKRKLAVKKLKYWQM